MHRVSITSRRSLFFLGILLVVFSKAPAALAQPLVDWNGSNSINWFDSANWDGEIPNAPGAAARIVSSSTALTGPEATSAATLGRLQIEGGGNVRIDGFGPLTFDNPGDESAILNLDSAGGLLLRGEIFAPVNVPLGEQLSIDVSSRSELHLLSRVSGDITKTGIGPLLLLGDNSNGSGSLTIEAGDLSVRNVNAFAGFSEVRVGPEGSITFPSQRELDQFDLDFVIPRLTLDGAPLRLVAQAQNSVNIAANIDLLDDSVITGRASSRLFLNGTIEGAGGLTFSLGASSFVSIDGETSYSGETVIPRGVTVLFRQSGALGDASAGTIVNGGELQLMQGGGNEQIRVLNGNLFLGGAQASYGHRVTLENGTIYGGEDGIPGLDEIMPATLASKVHFSGGLRLGQPAMQNNLVLHDVEGIGSVYTFAETTIVGELSVRGDFAATFRDSGRLAGKLSVLGDIFANDAVLDLAGDLEAPTNSFFVSGPNRSSIQVSHDNQIRNLVIDPRDATRSSFHQGYALRTVDDATLSVAEELRFHGGTISGAIQGQDVLTKQGSIGGYLEDIRGSGFSRVDVEGGVLTVRGDSGDSAPAIHLGSHESARLVLQNAVYHGEIFLNNAPAVGEAALTIFEDSTVAGDIHLGEQGSSVSSGTVSGSIHGGDLQVRGRTPLRLTSNDHTYSGSTLVAGQDFTLVDDGALHSTSSIRGIGRLTTFGGRAGLVLDNSGTTANADRIGDSIPIHLGGMRLALEGRAGESVSERLGVVHAGESMSTIAVVNPFEENSRTTLTLETIQREPGGAVRFDLGRTDQPGEIFYEQTPELTNGILGGWATVRSRFSDQFVDFATYGPDGVVAYSDLNTYGTNVGMAGETDNVDLTNQNQSITSNSRVNALRLLDSSLNLNENSLTVDSGGIILQSFPNEISNGQLTAGVSNELIVTGGGAISADIVDNSKGSVGLTYASDFGQLTLSGTNTYSGPTIFASGDGSVVELGSADALPSGTDLLVEGSDVRFSDQSTEPLVLGQLELHGGLLRSTSARVELQPEELRVQSGELSQVRIVGDAPITKTTNGVATLRDSLAQHTGPVVIEQGRLSASAFGAAPLDDEHSISIQDGASLFIDADFAIADRKIRLDGGTIEFLRTGGVSGPVEVLSGGASFRRTPGRNFDVLIDGQFSGDGPIFFEGSIDGGEMQFAPDLSDYTGTVHLTGGRVLVSGDASSFTGNFEITAASVTASGVAFGDSLVTVSPEGRLVVQNDLTANLDVRGGSLSIESPGGRAAALDGEISFNGESRIVMRPRSATQRSVPTIRSTVRMADQSTLRVTSAGNEFSLREPLIISGDVFVEGDATIASFDSLVTFAGAIQPASPVATLNLLGNDTLQLGTIRIDENRSFSILQDGQPQMLELSQTDSLAGNGTYVGDVTVVGGAALVPGSETAATFTVDGDLVLGMNGVLELQLGEGLRGVDYDAIDVSGSLTLDDAVLDIALFDGFMPDLNDQFVLLQADRVDGTFSNALDSFTIGEVEFPVIYESNRVLLGNAVPEPSSCALLIVAIAGLLHFRRK